MQLPKPKESRFMYETILLMTFADQKGFSRLPSAFGRSLTVDERSSLMASWLIQK